MTKDPMVFQFIGDMVKSAMDVFIEPAAQRLISTLQMLTLTGVTLYITLTGYAIATGAVESPFWTFIKQCLKIIIIAFFAFTADGYIHGVMDAIKGLESGLSDAMSIGGHSTSIYQVLDQSLGKGIQLVVLCFRNANAAGWHLGSAFGWVVAGCVIALGTALVAALGGAVVIVAKFSLSVMFALGPLFIMCLMFPMTARFFDSWFSQVMNYVLTVVIMAIIMTFAIKAYDSFLAGADFSSTSKINPMFAAVQIGCLTGVLAWIILQAGGMASGLAGGISMAAMGIRHLMMPVTGGLRAAKSVGNTLNPVSTRRDVQSGLMVTAHRSSHMIAGNTLFNPAYRQHVMQNLGKGWGHAKGGNVKKD